MAVDVIARPEGRCLTVVADAGAQALSAEEIVVSGQAIDGFVGGIRFMIGVFTPAMAAAAALCDKAVLVEMDRGAVVRSRQVRLTVA